ncbi:MAG: response regulator [Gemmatimonadota bacterium]|jgi:PleD family two-component response regulator|nr:response regulator [Gemmatimonadota bacterium]
MGRILFADDDPAMRVVVTDALTSAGLQLRTVSNGADALLEVLADPPDLVLLDYRMGTPDGLEVCRRIKDNPQLQHLPVLILTADGDLESRIRGFEAGANDYLPKPFDTRELIARVRALLLLAEQSRGLNPSTGLPGGSMIEREFAHRQQRGEPFALCYLDLTDFKSFNDRFGFATANQVIERTGAILSEAVAGTPHFAGHIGGDDFVVFCTPEAARALVTGVQRRFEEALSGYVPSEVFSFGVYQGRPRNGEEQSIPLTRIVAVVLHLDPATMPPLTVLAESAAAGKAHAKTLAATGLIEVNTLEA